MAVVYINVYEDRKGRWHYGMRMWSREGSVRVADSLLRYIGQPFRRHVCRLKVTYK